MASTYTEAGIELITTGEQSGTWGTTTNTNWSMMEEMVTGVQAIALTGTTYTLTTSDGVSSEGRHALIAFSGSPGGTCTVTVSPSDMQKIYFIKNGSDQTVTITQGSGGNVSIAAGAATVVYCDGAGASAAVSNFSLSLPTTDGTNGQALITDGSGNISFGDVDALPSQTGNSGKYLTTDGSNPSWATLITPAKASGSIIVNAQTISEDYTVPTGSNGFSVGPITVSSGYSVTVSSDQRWVVI